MSSNIGRLVCLGLMCLVLQGTCRFIPEHFPLMFLHLCQLVVLFIYFFWTILGFTFPRSLVKAAKTNSSPSTRQRALDVGTALFYNVTTFVSEDTKYYAPTCQFFSSVIEVLGQVQTSVSPFVKRSMQHWWVNVVDGENNHCGTSLLLWPCEVLLLHTRSRKFTWIS